jgi:hypothetical protein
MTPPRGFHPGKCVKKIGAWSMRGRRDTPSDLSANRPPKAKLVDATAAVTTTDIAMAAGRIAKLDARPANGRKQWPARRFDRKSRPFLNFNEHSWRRRKADWRAELTGSLKIGQAVPRHYTAYSPRLLIDPFGGPVV